LLRGRDEKESFVNPSQPLPLAEREAGLSSITHKHGENFAIVVIEDDGLEQQLSITFRSRDLAEATRKHLEQQSTLNDRNVRRPGEPGLFRRREVDGGKHSGSSTKYPRLTGRAAYHSGRARVAPYRAVTVFIPVARA
jgi:hypothetical protein